MKYTILLKSWIANMSDKKLLIIIIIIRYNFNLGKHFEMFKNGSLNSVMIYIILFWNFIIWTNDSFINTYEFHNCWQIILF